MVLLLPYSPPWVRWKWGIMSKVTYFHAILLQSLKRWNPNLPAPENSTTGCLKRVTITSTATLLKAVTISTIPVSEIRGRPRIRWFITVQSSVQIGPWRTEEHETNCARSMMLYASKWRRQAWWIILDAWLFEVFATMRTPTRTDSGSRMLLWRQRHMRRNSWGLFPPRWSTMSQYQTLLFRPLSRRRQRPAPWYKVQHPHQIATILACNVNLWSEYHPHLSLLSIPFFFRQKV